MALELYERSSGRNFEVGWVDEEALNNFTLGGQMYSQRLELRRVEEKSDDLFYQGSYGLHDVTSVTTLLFEV